MTENCLWFAMPIRILMSRSKEIEQGLPVVLCSRTTYRERVARVGVHTSAATPLLLCFCTAHATTGSVSSHTTLHIWDSPQRGFGNALLR